MGRKTYSATNRNAFTDLALGIRVDRATATLPQSTSSAIFNIVGGRVILRAIVGQVTTVLGAVGNLKLTSTPTSGTASDICAVVAAGSTAVQSLISIDGIAGNAAIIGTGAVRTMGTTGVILPVGTLDLSLSSSSTGSVKWTVCYQPLDDGAYMTST